MKVLPSNQTKQTQIYILPVPPISKSYHTAHMLIV